MTEHSGACLCGAVTFTLQGDFESFYLCHCQRCQKGTGSAHVANLFAPGAQLTWLTGAQAVSAYTLPGTQHHRSFCKVCGSALPDTQLPGFVVVPAGCLDTPVGISPTAHIYVASRAGWDQALADVPAFEALPD